MTEWRCFQCDKVFTDSQSALTHFGRDTLQPPACCDRDLSNLNAALQRLREEEDHSRDLFRQKLELEKNNTTLLRALKAFTSEPFPTEAWLKMTGLDRQMFNEAKAIVASVERRGNAGLNG